MTAKEKSAAIKSMLYGISEVIYATVDFLDYGDETENAIIKALNALQQQTWSLRLLIEKIPF